MATTTHLVAFDRPLAGAVLPAYSPRRYTEADLAAARAEGHRAGADEARAFADRQLVELRAEVQELQAGLGQRLRDAHEDLLAQVRAALPVLAVEVGRRLLAEFEPEPAQVERLCRATLDQLYPERTGLELHICPADAAKLERLDTDWKTHFPGLTLTIDDTLVPGDCVVRSRFGLTDARGVTKLEGLRRELLGA